jgi:hypothetical protein
MTLNLGRIALLLLAVGWADRPVAAQQGTARAEPQRARAEPAAARPGKTVYLDQGWTDEERLRFYGTDQGSQYLPYRWLLALEQADGREPFLADAHIERFRYLPAQADPRYNPDGLPVGFVRDAEPVLAPGLQAGFLAMGVIGADESRRGARISPEEMRSAAAEIRTGRTTRPITNSWFGFTCAACHTGQIDYQGTRIRVDGAPTLADFFLFHDALVEALTVTSRDDAKFERFAGKVLPGRDDRDEEKVEALRKEVRQYTSALRAFARRNHSPTAYGYARLDAFGILINEIVGTALEVPENYRVPNAPVSYPFLWDTPRLAWVQWNGSASNPFARNIGEVMGVFAHLVLAQPVTERFDSSIKGTDLYQLEQMIGKLKPPAWPEAILGRIDRAKAQRGGAIYAQQCASCHADRPPYPLTPPNPNGKQFIQVTMTPLQALGTDPTMATNFATRTSLPGVLAPLFPNRPTVPTPLLLGGAVGGVQQRIFLALLLNPQQILEYTDFRTNSPPPNLLAYKARPLAGIWATAPYLHNGSVPNLEEILLPAARRSQAFHVGSREFDPARVGFVTRASRGTFEFRTSEPANSNAGHEFGTTLPDAQRGDLLEYLKTL